MGDPRWLPFAKGGDYQCYYQQLDLVVDWSQIGVARRISNSGAYLKPGVTYTERTASDPSFRFLSPGCVFSPQGVTIGPVAPSSALRAMLLLNTRIARMFIEMCVGSGGALSSGGVARHYGPRIVGAIPFPEESTDADAGRLAQLAEHVSERTGLLVSHWNETSLWFVSPFSAADEHGCTVDAIAERRLRKREAVTLESIGASYEAERVYAGALGLTESDEDEVRAAWGTIPLQSKVAYGTQLL